jgi:pimeloyl-ACP methyl ester carboxylesterase
MPVLHTPRLRVHYEEAGAGPEAFVLVHGNFASWRWWRPVIDRLRPGWRAIMPDLRGCGDTPGGTAISDLSPYGIPELALDLAGFVDALGLSSFHLAGHSLGGAVALEYAVKHQERLRSLTLAAPPPPAGLAEMRRGTGKSASFLNAVDPDNGHSMAALHASHRLHRLFGTNRWMLRRALSEMMPSVTLDRAFGESLLTDAARMSPDAVVGFLQALHRWNIEDRLPALRVPTVIVWGARDVLVPRAGLERMAGLLPEGELVVWPDAGHSPQIERPEDFVALLARRVPGPLGGRVGRWLRRVRRLLQRNSPPAAGVPA